MSTLINQSAERSIMCRQLVSGTQFDVIRLSVNHDCNSSRVTSGFIPRPLKIKTMDLIMFADVTFKII